ncbi:RagB/SusD family nutrient uptake outer membrane protein [Arachidicoccus terrestris]|uniref:RagB/SusD family nutrient uptake outer membrane protein n=1 Tax=Arachidicoccus terrestris TaxID=2875539 RepID=UPI001CC4E2AB|nr:RagB/SusD family nutrient uptake outer membrane protein [Arachidicoccus terrestris]UAY56954.1 RagB/SusD family nutrient uptake outer membrane protein [Arachidicoccus terrestris]
MKTRLIYTIVSCSLVMGTISCSKFMDRDTYDSVSAGSYFASETDLELYANGFIQKMTPSASTIGYSDINADYCAVQIPTDLLRTDGNVSPENQGGWSESSWSNLRNINYFLNNLPRAKGKVSEEVYNHYEGVGRFWRAVFYFDKVQTFGGVPYYQEVINSSDVDALQKPRDSREFVMDKVLQDLQFAVENCSSSDKYTSSASVINKWIAAAYLSRVALFEGTYRKYHATDPSTGKSWQNRDAAIKKFLTAAVDAATMVMNSGVYSLVTGDPKTAYRSLFTSAALKKQEVIWGRSYSNDLAILHDLTWLYFSPTYGSRVSLTKTFINSYLNLDGTPFTNSSSYKTKTFSEEFTNRDYRLMQTVISPEYMMTQNNVTKLYAPNWLVTKTGYQPIKFSLDNDAGGVTARAASWNSLPIIRYAEVLLNYAEAKAELGTFTVEDWNKTIALTRDRAGVKAIYPATADPYLLAYYRNTVTSPVLLEIRRERAIELCLEDGLRWDDLMRWHLGELLNSSENPWKGIYVPDVSKPYDFNGDGVTDFQIGSSESPNSIKLNGAGAIQTFSRDADGNLIWNYPRVWEEYKYLRPIPLEAITRNPNLEQNYLWKNK